MNRSRFVILLAAVTLLGFAASGVYGYGVYRNPGDANDGCYQCHPTFTPKNLANGLHNATHVGSTQMTNTCGLCHTSTGDIPRTNSGGADASHSCNGCHVGPGLRKHHLTAAGVPADGAGRRCNNAGCHPSDPTPVGENVLPTFYSRVDVNVHNPCLADKNAGGEHWDGDLVDLRGLDNDGDLLYETQDPNCGATGVLGTTPSQFELAPPYPNPAKGRVTLDLAVPRAVAAKVVVYDQAGRAVRTIADREFAPGRYSLEWDTRDNSGKPVRGGIYFVIFRAADMSTARTIAFIR